MNPKQNKLLTIWKSNYTTYGIVIVFYLVMQLLQHTGNLSRLMRGQLIPICAYVVAAISLNMTVGILGELSLGHACFMSVGCFMGALTIDLLADVIPGDIPRLIIGILVGALAAMIIGFLIGLPVLRLNGDYLAIVTLACGEIIKSLLTNTYIGKTEKGLNISMFTSEVGLNDSSLIIRGPQGLKNADLIADYTVGTVLVLLCLIIIFNLINSKTGRAVLALRDNKIAARSIGINITKYKMMAFVISAAMAGAAGALYGQCQTAVLPSKFDFNTSILILVFVVMGGLGNIRGSMIAAVVLLILPEMLRFLLDYRMIIYAVVLILVMLVRNSQVFSGLGEKLRKLFSRLFSKKTAAAAKEGADRNE